LFKLKTHCVNPNQQTQIEEKKVMEYFSAKVTSINFNALHMLDKPKGEVSKALALGLTQRVYIE